MREIYLKPFQIVVRDAQPWAIMASYNRVNGLHTSENPQLLDGILRNEWGWSGTIMYSRLSRAISESNLVSLQIRLDRYLFHFRSLESRA